MKILFSSRGYLIPSCVCTLLCLLSFSLLAQSFQGLDSLRQSLRDSTPTTAIMSYYKVAAQYHRKFHLPDSEYVNIVRGLGLAKQIKDPLLIGDGYLEMGYHYINVRQYAAADSCLSQSYQMYANELDTLRMAKALLARSKSASKLGRAQHSIDYLLEAKEGFEHLGDRRGAMIALQAIGVKFSAVKQYREALNYFQEAWKMKDLLNESVIANLLYSMALARMNLYKEGDSEQLDTALILIDKGSQFSNQHQLIYYETQFGLMQVEQDLINEDYQLAFAKSEKLVEAGKNTFNEKTVCEAYSYLAKASSGLKHYGNALIYADSMMVYAKKMKWDSYLRSSLQRKYFALKGLGKYQEALPVLERFQAMHDSLTRTEGVEKLKAIEEKYEASKKEKEILALNQERAQLQQSAQLQTERIKSKNAILIAMASLGGLGFFFFYYRYQRRMQAEQRRAENIKSQLWRAQINPHFLFNSLNSIQRFYVEGKTEEGNDLMADFGELLRKILDRSKQATVSITEELDFLRLYLELEKRKLRKPLEYSVQVAPHLAAYYIQLPSLLLQPLVENAIKHGIANSPRDGRIEIEIGEAPIGIRCVVRDNGIGFAKRPHAANDVHDSIGLKLVKERLGSMGQFEMQTLRNDDGEIVGTEVILIIPTSRQQTSIPKKQTSLIKSQM